ncbi:toxin secretion/phage lysis holin [Herbinix hemicellulosilytica]|uniref:Putative membrane protein n=1 Tax=Herbinix hemicellulosilytica TaxID=1564487 RepID=A0A0H5SHF3_HERHM|nr:phage holin family protein [Herbinix hemicellulosilytica]RBP58879.1 toxin secretion/phage lysis holin [Herbinix hemicellulosilytica]CRZ34914.1 putative membrane protein [Herbinix hemicellulosilytica]
MNKFKTIFTTIFSVIASWLGALAIPVLLMILSNLVDYVTGLIASKYRDEPINSYKSFRGIAKKICMWLLVIVGALVDQLILYAGDIIGIKMPFTFLIACVVAIWIICNELISILENIKDIGVKLPPFLQPLVENVKKQVEEKAKVKDDANG